MKVFAKQMIDDHGKVNAELRSLAERKKLEVEDDASLTDKAKATLLDLRDASFDPAYANNQVAAHEKAVELFTQAADNLTDPELQAFAKTHLPALKHHLRWPARWPRRTHPSNASASGAWPGMSFSLWLLVLGCILLTLGLASAYLRLLPVSTSFIYLLFGLAIGPAGLHAWRSGLADISGWFEHLSEAALLISLFIGGLKLRLPLRSPAWTAAWLLAGPVLLGCILGLTLGAHFLFGLDWGLALLVAAIPRAHRSGAGQRHPGQPRRRRRPPALRRIRRGGTQRRHRLSLRHRRPAADPVRAAACLGVRPQRPGLAAARACSGRFRSACWWAIAWAMVSAAWPSTCGRGTPTPRCRPTTSSPWR